MGLLVWGMMGIAIWHFAVFVPDRFWGGIVGAFLGAIVGAMIVGLIVQGTSGRDIDNTDLGTALVAIPGALVGLAALYLIGVQREAGRGHH
jgi:hypothetical protein